jgi:hypothetical protein
MLAQERQVGGGSQEPMADCFKWLQDDREPWTEPLYTAETTHRCLDQAVEQRRSERAHCGAARA